MKYPPGSFTKNFAWHDKGFRRLHEVISAGFSGGLTSVSQAHWRTKSGEPRASMQLVPLNFFLHQTGTGNKLNVSVDELVHRATSAAHSLAFDRLALFAFHLNIAGDNAYAKTGHRGWATWANEFVRDELWTAKGGWTSSTLTDSKLKSALATRISAEPAALTKCFTNYRYFFRLADYWKPKSEFVNTRYEAWLVPALFLTWDRWNLDRPIDRAETPSELVDVALKLEVHKLVGAPEHVVRLQAELSAADYCDFGGLLRFGATSAGGGKTEPRTKIRKKSSKTGASSTRTGAPKMTASELLAAMDGVETDSAVERQMREHRAQVRNRMLATAIKQLYDDKCIFCETLLQVGLDPDVYYVEAAHIKPLGSPHDGPDKAENLIPLCPNHHLQFDRGVLRIAKDGHGFVIHSKIAGHPLHGRKLSVDADHKLDPDCVKYHFDWFSRR